MKKLSLNLKLKDMWWKSMFSDDEIPLVENLVKKITITEIKVVEACFSTYSVIIKIEDTSNKVFKHKKLTHPLFEFPSNNKLDKVVLFEVIDYVKRKLSYNLFEYKRNLLYMEYLRRYGHDK